MLKKKQHSRNEEWLDAWDKIEGLPAYNQVDALAAQAVERIRKAKEKYKRCAFAWSGGKDSIVLGELCRKAGIRKSLFVTSAEFDYPEFLAWVGENKPSGCEIIDINLGYSFLEAHPDMLFPTTKVLPKWYTIIQHKGQRRYYAAEKLDCMFMGRRIADGNMIRGNAEDCFAMYTADGRNVLCPIADWKHEDVLAYLKKNKLALPPIYAYPDGWRQGTHLWVSRLFLGNEQKNWQELYSFAPDIVRKASAYLTGARIFLDSVKA